MIPCPLIATYRLSSGPGNIPAWLARYVVTTRNQKSGAVSTGFLPMIFEASSEAGAIEAAEAFWASEQANCDGLEEERDTQEALKDAARIELSAANAKLAELRNALKWVGEVYPSMNRESGGAVVHMTWEEWNAMRLALGLKEQPARDTRKRRVMEGTA